MSDATPPVTPGAAPAPAAPAAPAAHPAPTATEVRRRPFALEPPPVPLVVVVITIVAVLVLTACSPGSAQEPTDVAGPPRHDLHEVDEVRGGGSASADANARYVEDAVVAGLAQDSEEVRAALADDRSVPPACMAVIGLLATAPFVIELTGGTLAPEEGAALEAMRAEWWGRVPPELDEALDEIESRMRLAAERLGEQAERDGRHVDVDVQAVVAEVGLGSREAAASMAEVEEWLTRSCQVSSW